MNKFTFAVGVASTALGIFWLWVTYQVHSQNCAPSHNIIITCYDWFPFFILVAIPFLAIGFSLVAYSYFVPKSHPSQVNSGKSEGA